MTRRRRPSLPYWWPWQKFLSAHVLRRMTDRDFDHDYLVALLSHVRSVKPSHVDGRFVATCVHFRQTWHIVL